MRPLARSLLVSGLMLFPLRVWADPDPVEVAARRQLIQDAAAARQAGNHDQALELATRAANIQITPSLMLFIAEESQVLHRDLDALRAAEECLAGAQRDTTIRNREVVITTCTNVINATQGSFGHVTVTAPSPTPEGTQILLGEHVLDPRFWGVAYAVRPGHLQVSASATERVPFRREVDISAGGTASVSVELPTPAPVQSVVVPVQPLVPPVRRPSIVGPVVLMGVGAASLVVGIATGATTSSSVAQLEMACPGRICVDSPELRNQYAGAQTMAAVTNAMTIVGGLLIAGGGAWLVVNLVTSRPRERASLWHITPTVSGYGPGIEGRF